MLPRGFLGADVRLGRSVTNIAHPVLDRALRNAPGWLTADQQAAQLSVDGVAAFSITDGRCVVVDLLPGADPLEVREWIFGIVATIVLGQQGRVSLHASSVDVGGATVAVAGGSGAGKSTVGLMLEQRGHLLITDDVSPLAVQHCPDRRATVSVVPFGRSVHVWRETAAAIGLRIPESHDTLAGSQKIVLPAPDAAPGELRRIVVLESDDSVTAVQMSRVREPEAVQLLTAHVHGVYMVSEIWPELVFHWAVSVAEAVPVYRVSRPATGWTAQEVADGIERIAATAAWSVA